MLLANLYFFYLFLIQIIYLSEHWSGSGILKILVTKGKMTKIKKSELSKFDQF